MLLDALTHEWQRLGDVAAKLGAHGSSKLITVARKLRNEGLIESRYHGTHYQWRLSASAIEARRAATGNTDAVHESAVGKAETPNPNPETPHVR